MAPEVRSSGRRNGKPASAAAQALAETLAERFEWNPRSQIDPASRVAMGEVDNGDGTTMVKLLTFGQIAAAVVEAGWTPPKR